MALTSLGTSFSLEWRKVSLAYKTADLPAVLHPRPAGSSHNTRRSPFTTPANSTRFEVQIPPERRKQGYLVEIATQTAERGLSFCCLFRKGERYGRCTYY